MLLATEYGALEFSLWLLVAALVGLVIGWLIRKWWLDRQESEEVAALLAAEADKIAKAETERDGLQAKVEGLTADLERRGADADRANSQLSDRDEAIANLEATVEAAGSEANKEAAKLKTQVEDREATIASLRAAAEKENPQVAEVRKELEGANGVIGTLRKDADGYKGTIEALRTDLDAERRKQADLEEKLDGATAEAESATASLANARTSIEGLQAQVAELEPGSAASADGGAGLQADLEAARRDRDDFATRLAALQEEHGNCASPSTETTVAEAPAPLVDLPDKDVAVAKVAEIAARTRGDASVADDDLKKIHGVGPKLEGLLKSMDITSFRQVANFTLDDIQYVTAALDAFPGRIERDDWMSSAADEHAEKYGDQI
ncbi:MAG: hypothetical protein GY722_05270 [bacterium]|nr:hypothetical protein [bacterium]